MDCLNDIISELTDDNGKRKKELKARVLVCDRYASKAQSAILKASDLAKQDINENIEFFTIKDKNAENVSFYTFPKNAITGINAESGTGKSFLAVEIAFELLETKQVEKVVYIDLDRNYQGLRKRKQAYYIQMNDNFVLLNTKRLNEMCMSELSKITSDLKAVETSYQKDDIETIIKELEIKSQYLSKMLNKFDRLALFEYLISDYPSDDFKHLENSVFILDSINGFIPKLTDNTEIIKAFQGVLFTIIERGGTIIYLNHTTKGKKSDGELNFSGAMNLQNNSDYFVLISKPFSDRDVFNIQVLKNRHMDKKNYALELRLNQPLGSRLVKCDFIAIDENATQKQKDSRLIILENLRDNKKRYSELKALFLSNGLSENDLNNNLKSMLSQGTITKKQSGANVFYILANTEPSQPKIYEFSDDSQIA